MNDDSPTSATPGGGQTARRAEFAALEAALGTMLRDPSSDPAVLAEAVDGLSWRQGQVGFDHLRMAERAVDVLLDLCWTAPAERAPFFRWYRRLALWSGFHDDLELSHRLHWKVLAHCRDPRYLAAARYKVAKFGRLLRREASTRE